MFLRPPTPRPRRRPLRLARLLGLALALPCVLPAATLSYQTEAPVPGPDDIYNFSGATGDRDNVGGDGTSDGSANDFATYLSDSDRPHQGQTFTTGNHPAGYRLGAVWIRHAAYSAGDATTWWRTPAGASLALRITDPTAAGTAGFALHTDSVVTTGSESGTPNALAPVANATNTAAGTGVWLRLALDTPVTLYPNSNYGFDVTATSGGFFLETDGLRDAAATGGDAHAGGTAYHGSTNGAPDTTLQSLAGDRVFLIELSPADSEGGEQPDLSPLPDPLHVAEPFPLERVRLLPGRFKSNQDLLRTGYLAWIEPDRLLFPFRANAGLPQAPGATHLGGWEGDGGFTAVRGHMAGHYLTSAAKMYAATGDTSFLPKIDRLVAGLKACQDALAVQEIAAGRVGGYLSAFPVSDFETLENNPRAAPVPFYTIHKILAGLVDAYRHCGNAQALDIAIAMADYHRWRVSRLTASQIEAMFRTDDGNSEEWGGMNETLADLYRLSRARGDANPGRHLEFARLFHRDWFINPLVNDQDPLAGLHANTHVPQVVGFAHVAALLPESDPQRARLLTAAERFWRLVTERHWLVNGGNSYHEHFAAGGIETGPAGSALEVATAETCNTHNMLKLTAELFQQVPSARLADYHEHALYNHILASLSPDTGMATYFVPLVSGHFKTYGRPEGSSWCCTGTGIENPARYNDGIYFHDDDTLWVNLFIPSTLDWSERGLGVRQETDFPESGTVRLILSAPAPTPAKLRLRIPAWIAGPPTLTVNGVGQTIPATASSYAELDRTWSDGDVVTLTLPMGLRLDRSMDDPSQVSLFHGPVLLAGDLGTAGMPPSDQAAGQLDYQNVPRVGAPLLIAPAADELDLWVRPGSAPLTYLADAAAPGATIRGRVALRPFYDIHHTRYAVYWNLVAPTTVSSWTGGETATFWSTSTHWDAPTVEGSALVFDAPMGGAPINDFAPGRGVGGIEFGPDAGAFTLGGNAIALQGDVLNRSAHAQRIDLPLELRHGLPWFFHAAGSDLTIGGALTGSGSLLKTGPGPLSLEGSASFAGEIGVFDGSLRVGAGGDLGRVPASVSAGAELILDRPDDVDFSAPLTGAGDLVKRGPGTLRLLVPLAHSGLTRVETGDLAIGSVQRPVLAHRWSFNGDLADSAGDSPASIVEVGNNNATLTAAELALEGGAQGASDYVSLGPGLLPENDGAVTLEFWATQTTRQNWGRIFDVGTSPAENLFMSWCRESLGTDRIEWNDAASTTVNDTYAPLSLGVEQHIVLVIEPGAGNDGQTRLTWYVAPASAASLGAARGAMESANTLAELDDAHFWLGRSHYADPTASARYNEVRIWTRAFSAEELQQLHALGPDALGGFDTVTDSGALSGASRVELLPSATLRLEGTTQELASLSAPAGAVVDLGAHGRLVVRGGTGADPDSTFAGAILGTGELVNDGTLRLVGAAELPAGLSLRNRGLLDLMTWHGTLPAAFQNEGRVLDRSAVKVDALTRVGDVFELRLHGHRGHRYQLQFRDDLSTGEWLDRGPARAGGDVELVLSDTGEGEPPPVRRFYRVVVDP